MKREELSFSHPPALLPRYERAAVQYDRACEAMDVAKTPMDRHMAAALVLYWHRQKERAS